MKKLNFISTLTIGFVAGIVWIAACGGSSAIPVALAEIASNISYSNSTSALSATTVQAAIDELSNASAINYDNTDSNLVSTNVQDAIDELKAGEWTEAQIQTAATSAMGTEDNSNALNHARYTDAEALTYILANDGSSSTLDADKLDGLDSTKFVRNDQTNSATITANGFALSSASTGYFTIPGVAFMPEATTDTDANTDYSTSAAITRISANGSALQNFYAPVYLPNNSTITAFNAYIYDDAGMKNLTLTLQRQPYNLSASTTIDTISSQASSGSSGYELITGTIDDTYSTIDNNTYTYMVKVSFPASPGANLAIGTVKITYNYTNF